MAINNGEVDIETCPIALAKTLMSAKSSQKNPLREQVSKPVVVAETAQNVQFILNPLFSTYPPYSPVQYHSYDHPLSYPSYSHPQELSPLASRTFKHVFNLSSPMQFETNVESDKLAKYFD